MKILRGHLYLANLNPSRGSESGKIRPVLVIQNDYLNLANHPSTWILPCTSQLTLPNILRCHIPAHCSGNDKACDVMIDQSRAIDNKRFSRHLGPLPASLLSEVEEKLKLLAGL